MTSGRRILITGTSRGLGRVLAERYLAQGDLVMGCARGEATLSHERYSHHCADISDEAQVRELFRSIRKQCQGLDVLINNAGTASMNPVALMPPGAVRRIVETNFIGAYLCAQAAIRLLRASGAGRIVNLTSVAVPLRLEGEAAYAASKSALETFTRILAREVGRLGITCNAVGPSPIRTRLVEGVPEGKLQALIDRQAIPRWAEPEDVVNVVDFFLRPESGMVTGQVIYLAGVG